MRKPVRSVVADRKYFQGGGLTKNTNPMAVSQPSGIMASSQPLVDMVANSANNPQGGMSPLNYANGGTVYLNRANQIPTESSILNFNSKDLNRRLTPNIQVPELEEQKPLFEVPEEGSRFMKFLNTKINFGLKTERILKTKVNFPLKSPLKGIGQYFFSEENSGDKFTIQKDFPTASSSQLATLDALVQMNPNNEDEIYTLGKKIITDDKSDATGKNLANLLQSEKLLLDKKDDDELDRIQKEANEQARKEAEGKEPKIDPEPTTVVKSTSDADKKKTITEQVDPNQVDKDQVDKDQVDPNQVDQDQVDQDQKNTEIGTAIDTTTQAVQKNIEAIKEAANTNDEKKVTDNLEGYIEEFKAAMPKYEGMTEEEKGFAIIEAGLNIAAGQSTNAIMNIANGLKPVVAKLAKNKKEEKAFNTQINISAAKYGIERLNNDRQRNFSLEDEMRKYMRQEKTFFVSNPKGETIDGVFYKQGSPITLTNEQVNEGAFEKLKGKVTSEGIMKQIISDASDLFKATTAAELANLKDSRVTPKESKTLLDISSEGRTFAKEAETNVKMMAFLDVGMEYNAEKKITGLNNYFKQKIEKLSNAAPILKEVNYLDKLAKDGAKKSKIEYQQQVIANMMIKEILGEGSKNVSNIDRQLAGEIVGLLKGSETIFANPEILHQKLQTIRGRISSNLEDNIASMMDVEEQLLAIEFGKGLKSVESLRRSRAEKFKFTDPREQKISDKVFEEQFGARIPENVLQAKDYFNLETGEIKKKI